MSSKTSRPLTVFAASILALGAVTAIGITVGCGIVAVVPAVWVKRVAAGLFFLAGVLVLFDVL
jgi:putative Ca2+/H+ antiporter (TMEM165/GDT1 family)